MTNEVLTPRHVLALSHELSGVIVDVTRGSGFDCTCLDTLNRVQQELHDMAERVRMLQASEKEGWRYSDELEQERLRLTAIIKTNGFEDKELT